MFLEEKALLSTSRLRGPLLVSAHCFQDEDPKTFGWREKRVQEGSSWCLATIVDEDDSRSISSEKDDYTWETSQSRAEIESVRKGIAKGIIRSGRGHGEGPMC